MGKYGRVKTINSFATMVLLLACIAAWQFVAGWAAITLLVVGFVVLSVVLPSQRTEALKSLANKACPRCQAKVHHTPQHGAVEFYCRSCVVGYSRSGKEIRERDE